LLKIIQRGRPTYTLLRRLRYYGVRTRKIRWLLEANMSIVIVLKVLFLGSRGKNGVAV